MDSLSSTRLDTRLSSDAGTTKITGRNMASIPAIFYQYCNAASDAIAIRNRIVERNINLARKAAWKMASDMDSYQEYFQVACEGLIRAVERFDPTLGYQFSTFAMPTIQGYILNWIRDNRFTIRNADQRCYSLNEELVGTFPNNPTADYLPLEYLLQDCESFLRTLPPEKRYPVETIILQNKPRKAIAKTMKIGVAKIKPILQSALYGQSTISA